MRIHFSSFAILFTVSKSSAGDDISIQLLIILWSILQCLYQIKKRVRERCYKKLAEIVAEKIRKHIYNTHEIVDITDKDVDDLVLGNTAKLKDFDMKPFCTG